MRSIGWALFGVNFRPLQEIMGGRQIFDTGHFFRDYGIDYQFHKLPIPHYLLNIANEI